MKIMDWKTLVIVAAVVAVFFVWKRFTLAPAAAAREHLRQGALLVDVRSPQEFESRHVPGAVNIPLGQVGEDIQKHAKEKDRVILLHCLSGARSGLAARRLKSLGYNRVFNLGSYSRAEQIARSAKAP